MGDVDRRADLARIEVEQREARLAAEREDAQERQRINAAEKAMQQARARMILDQKRGE